MPIKHFENGDVLEAEDLNAIGQQLADTGWLTLTLGPGWTAVAGYTPEVRAIGSLVVCRGRISLGAGGAIAHLATSPIVPDRNTDLPTIAIGAGHEFVGQPQVTASGIIQLPAGSYFGAINTGAVVRLAGSWIKG